ncbi:unnamed protein product [Polarella glacialis]|uniref:3'(2'),5'-bisphosphate nucleotidase 1 n=1 Tax=Polarella glacialis TaxID=89957 RepID=A0A813E4A5_POLGL|nr:unnamed protein product [Polarella glacialis]
MGRILWGCSMPPSSEVPCAGVHVFGRPDWTRPSRPEGRCLTLVSRSRTAGLVAKALARLSDPGSPAGPLAAGKALITGTIAVGGAGYKVARITGGAADLWIFPRSGTSRWDTCAGEAMLQALGGLLRDKAGRPICYDPDGSFENLEGIIAGADPELVDCAVRACAKL